MTAHPDWKALGLPVKGSGALDTKAVMRMSATERPRAMKALRDAAGLSLTAMAEMAGLSEPTWENIEAGRRAAAPCWLLALAYLVLEKHVAQGGGQ